MVRVKILKGEYYIFEGVFIVCLIIYKSIKVVEIWKIRYGSKEFISFFSYMFCFNKVKRVFIGDIEVSII